MTEMIKLCRPPSGRCCVSLLGALSGGRRVTTPPPIKISDEAHEAASRAAEAAYRRWFDTPNRDAYVSGFIAAAAKNAVEAAAPLIAAQVLREAADIAAAIALDFRRTPPDAEGYARRLLTKATGAEAVRDRLRAEASGVSGGTPK